MAPATPEAVPTLLTRAELTLVGRLDDASNATFAVRLAGTSAPDVAPPRYAVYKPVAGEQRLSDFPAGTLAHREAACFRLSQETGWGLVPPTILRDGPYGPGSVQSWVHPHPVADPAEDLPAVPDPGGGVVDLFLAGGLPEGWLPVLEGLGARGERLVLAHADLPRLRRLALLDAVVNNADRKGGHVLADHTGVPFGVDHGLTFHVEPKLRTVLWGWAGQRFLDAEREALDHLDTTLRRDGRLRADLTAFLSTEEIEATVGRVRALRAEDRFPAPDPGRRAVPWPLF